MTTNDIILLAILSLGAIWINWGTIKRDLLDSQTKELSKPTNPVKNRERARREQESVESFS